MRGSYIALAVVLLLAPLPSAAWQVEKVRAGSSDAQKLPEDLFALPPGTWVFAEHLWEGDAPCTVEACEAGYTSGDLVVSVERIKDYVRVLAGFRGCASVAWNEYEIGDKASRFDTKTIARRVKKTVRTSAKYCKVAAPPAVAELDARRLYPAAPPTP